MANNAMSPVGVATIVEPVLEEEAADRRLRHIFVSSKFREQGNFCRIVSILKEHPKLSHRSYKSVYPNAEISPLCCILTSNAPCNLKVIRAVYELDPSAVVTPQGRNRDTALHFACRHNASMPVVEFIYSQNPAAISTLNGSGRPPLESLLPGLKTPEGLQSRLLTLNILLLASPNAIHVRNGRGQNLLEASLSLGGWSTSKALACLAERYVQPDDTSSATLSDLLGKVAAARRLRPRAKQSIQFRLLRAAPSVWAACR